jgi:hypothetical protein
MWMIAEFLQYGDLEKKNEISEGKGQIKHHATFKNAILVKAELDERVKSTGADGNKLVDEIDNNYTINYRDLTKAAKNALNYISSGLRRRDVCYFMWLFIRNYTRKGERCSVCGNKTWRIIASEQAKACFKCGKVKIINKNLTDLSRGDYTKKC